ncbi:MAG: universal stress protein [Kiritimatiellaeota bacterium]|nr:universal stress protein [Kiritimatiellota bacterium]
MNILVAYDFSEHAAEVMKATERCAISMAGNLWLIHVAEAEPDFVGYKAGPPTVREELALKFRKEHQELQRHAERLREAGVNTTALLVRGPVAATLLKEAERLQADVIVVGSHGHGAMLHLLLGSVSEQVLKKATCPVLVVPTHHPK